MPKKKPPKKDLPSRYEGVAPGYVRRSFVYPEDILEWFDRFVYWSRSARNLESERMIRHFMGSRKMDPSWLDEKGQLKPIPEEVLKHKRGRKPAN